MSVLAVADVKARLNKTTTADDAELQAMLDAAEAEYARLVSPIGSDTFRYDGTGPIILPRNATVTSASYLDGTPIPLADLYHNRNSGVLEWNAYRTSTSTYMVWDGALRDINVTFSTTLPAQDREAILADVAGLFAATQRGNSPGALPTGYESGLEDRTTPITLFPRIKALAAAYSGVA